MFAFTAPYSRSMPQRGAPLPWYQRQQAFDFVIKHGLAARAVGAPPTWLPASYWACCQSGTIPEPCSPPSCTSLSYCHCQPQLLPVLWPSVQQRGAQDCRAAAPADGWPETRPAAGVEVADARQAFEAAVAGGATPVQPPTLLEDAASGTQQTVGEVALYGDVVLRLVSGSYKACARWGLEAAQWAGRQLSAAAAAAAVPPTRS